MDPSRAAVAVTSKLVEPPAAYDRRHGVGAQA
jgi:hypothetical protein